MTTHHTSSSRPGSDAPAISVSGVTQRFGRVQALDGVDLTVSRGEIVALLGPNGAGKTTLLDLVLGFTTPTEGTLQVFGDTPRDAVKQGAVGAVLQTGALLKDLTVAETVQFVAGCHTRHLPLPDVMDRAGLTRIATRRVKKCSGGEQQRLRFGLALLSDPELLILDEPTAGMDVTARKEFWDTMHAEAERGRTVVFATHYLQEAADFADRIVLLRAGKIHADGSVSELVHDAPRTVRCTWLDSSDPKEFAEHHDIEVTHIDRAHGSAPRVTFSVPGSDRRSDQIVSVLLGDRLAADVLVEQASLDRLFDELAAADPHTNPGA